MPIVDRPWRFQNCITSLDSGTLAVNTPLNMTGPGCISIGTLNVMSTPSTLIPGALLTFDAVRVEIGANAATATACINNVLLNIVTAPTGTTTYTTFIHHLFIGPDVSTATGVSPWRSYVFDVKIPSGRDILFQGMGAIAATRAAQCGVALYGNPTKPDAVSPGVGVQTAGANTARSYGACINFTSLAGTFGGSWSTIGTMTNATRTLYVQFGAPDSGAMSALGALGMIGSQISTTVSPARIPGSPIVAVYTGTAEQSQAGLLSNGIPVDLPAGSIIVAKGYNSSSSAIVYGAMAHGVY